MKLVGVLLGLCVGLTVLDTEAFLEEARLSVSKLNRLRLSNGLARLTLHSLEGVSRALSRGEHIHLCMLLEHQGVKTRAKLVLFKGWEDTDFELVTVSPQDLEFSSKVLLNHSLSCHAEESKLSENASRVSLRRSFLNAAVIGDLPSEFDLREKFPQCKQVIERILDQGECGACYAFVAVSTAADRFCIYDAMKGNVAVGLDAYKYSVQDLLSCGSRSNGRICARVSSGMTNTFANGCEGGITSLTIEYVVEKGLLPESCQPFSVEDVPDLSHPNNLDCFLKNEANAPVTIKCEGRDRIYSVKLQSLQEALMNDKTFCTCPTESRINFEHVKTLLKSKKEPLQCIVETNSPVEVKCSNLVSSFASSGTFVLSDMRICRCPKEDQVNFDKVKVYEKGYGHLEQCRRETNTLACSSPRKLYDSQRVSGEMEMMTVIYESGSIAVSVDVYSDFQKRYDGKSIYQLPSKVFDAEQSAKLTKAERDACDSDVDCAYYLGGHALVLFGWGVENGIKYWLGKNSWGDDFGEKGIVKILRGENMIGIEENAVFAYAEPRGCQPPQFEGDSQCIIARFDSNANSCTVKNTCALPVRKFEMSYYTGTSQCGMIFTFPALFPGEETSYPDLLDCCVTRDLNEGTQFLAEPMPKPKACFQVLTQRGQCVVTNECQSPRLLSKAPNLRSFYEVAPRRPVAIDPSFCSPNAQLFSRTPNAQDVDSISM